MVFIYGSEEASYAGASAGGTGFLTSVPFEMSGIGQLYAHLYLVTNSHVAAHESSVAVRINAKDGGAEVFTIPGDMWLHHPDGDDIAAVSMESLSRDSYQLSDVPFNLYMTQEQRDNGTFGAGDECFVVGRNVGLEGQEFNTPACRFGAVSIMRPDKIYQPRRAHAQDSIVVEAKSLGGYSGAPVFIYQSPGISEPTGGFMENWPVVVNSYMWSGFALLGITWGHANGRTPVEGPWLDLTQSEKDLVVNSGMMLVVPAWKIADLLNQDVFVEERRRTEAKYVKVAEQESYP
ncbi:serine protease [Pseudonocardia kujensis]|uniref:trypsin-like peptidase domain-containing protein n=1 Tax=Pseudonocardia kujensis TaxID=1128675 RepID=UPI001E5D5711|nr:trypsin-like peptidase domain-containing protein [Pseudonocardia kujensis]MCE0764828.1 serine protease [Pseudonocardia kujensis]